MRKPIQISIPKPCHENWEEMTSLYKGRFCAACQKQVFDFTQSTDIDIAAALKSDKNVCGRFNPNQLKRNLTVPKKKKSMWMAVSFTALLGLTTTAASAQEPAKTEQHEKIDYPPVSGSQIIVKPKNIISGIVRDSIGPLPGASVIIYSKQRFAQTDENGKFEIEAAVGDTISISYVSFKDADILIASENMFVDCSLETMPTQYIMGDFIIKRTFFGRIFRSIGNWFR